ncbi:MAG: hypothetical protein RI531_04685 [Haloferacaceae archaeon]|nr:hypothetical protein [Haloferacaceae archaeon]
MHPEDRLIERGFEKRGYGEYEGYQFGQRIIFDIGQVNRGPDYRYEEPFWETQVFVEDDFGQVVDRELVATTSSERDALEAAVSWLGRW